MPRIKIALPLLLVLTGCLLPASTAGADWLITLEGKLIETRGPWTVEDQTLTYTDAAGEVHQIAVADVDLEASEETTAVKAGKPYVPKPKAEKPAAEAPADAKADESGPQVVLYMTSWCGYCRRTSKLLETLGVPFAAKDIEKDKMAAAEYREKADGYRGIPVLDVGGQIIRGYQPTLIHKLVTELQERQPASSSDGAEPRRP